MTTNRDNVKIEIFIAGEAVTLTVPYSRQESVRKCESNLNALYAEWCARFPRKTRSELMAMLAYQYASFFQELSERYADLSNALKITSDSLEELLEESAE